MAEILDPSEWIKLSVDEVVLIRRLLHEEQYREMAKKHEQADYSVVMACVRLDNVLGRLMDGGSYGEGT